MSIKCIEKDECIKNSMVSGTCLTNATCYSITKRFKKSTCQVAGCFDDKLARFYCKNKFNQRINYNQTNVLCCNEKDYCNRNKFDSLSIYAFYTLLVLVVILIPYLIHKKRQFKKNLKKKFKKKMQSDELSIVIEKSLHKEIELKENLGEGRFGTVFKGLLNGQECAVKVFASNDYDSYKKEVDIYKISSLSRESILKCIGWDTALIDFNTQYWLVLDYYEKGSLYDYLQKNVLKKEQLLSIILSTISGLNHLHDTQEFTVSKPGIAHRDFKTKNLLMKTDKTVCIADFGLSITSNEIYSTELKIKIQQGTRRYFAPEVLDESLNQKEFKSFTQADIYSFSLVFWESLNQSEFNSSSGIFQLPYYEYNISDPSIEQMKEIVVTKNLRPKLLSEDDNFNNDHAVRTICSIIKKCWDTDPKLRFDSLQIKEKLEDLYSEFIKK